MIMASASVALLAGRVAGARRCVRRSNNLVRCEAGSSSDGASAPLPRLPRSPREQVTQAAEAVRRAAASGKQLFEIEFSLPLIGATDLDDWPGGIRQQCAFHWLKIFRTLIV